MMNEAIIVLSTCPDRSSAQSIAQHLVENNLAACVNCVGGVTSTFRFQGKIEYSEEFLLIIKTTHAQYDLLEKELKDIHPYDVPEIVQIPITKGLPAYLSWISENIRLS